MDKLQKLLEVKELLNSISDKMNGLKLDIDYISGCIERGLFVSSDVSGRVIGGLGEINLLNAECRALYAQLELTGDILKSVEKDKEFISDVISKEEREGTLSKYKRFLLLVSDDETTMDLLDARKRELKCLLEENIGDYKDKLEPYNTFVEAILEDDSAKAFSYAMSLAPFFGNDLLAKAFIDKTIYMPMETMQVTQTIGSNDQEVILEELSATQYSSEDVIEEEIDIEEYDMDESQLVYVNEIMDAGLHVTKEYIDKEYYCFESPAETKDVGAKTFLKEIKSRRSMVDVEVVRTLGTYGVTTSKMVSSRRNISVLGVESSINYLHSKGYVRKYGINGVGSFCAFSPKGFKGISSSEVRSRLDIKGQAYKDNYAEINDIYHVVTRIAFTRMMECYMDAIDNISKLHSGVIMTEYCGNHFRDASNNNRYIFAGMFCNVGNDLDDFMLKLKKMIGDEYCHVMLLGIDEVIAKNNAKHIIEKIELDESKVYYHSLTDNSYYRYSDNRSIKFLSLFGKEEDIKDDIVAVVADIATQPDANVEIVDNQSEEEEIQEETIEKPEFVQLEEFDEKKIIEHQEDTALPVEDVALEKTNDSVGDIKSNVDMYEVMNNVYQMIVDDKIYCATTYLRSYMCDEKEAELAYGKLAYAVNEPWMRCSYNSEKIFDLYLNEDDVYNKYLMVSATLRNFFLNHTKFDHSMKPLHQNITQYSVVSDNNSLTKALYTIFKFKNDVNKGADYYASYRTKDKEAIRKEIETIKMEAKSYYDSYVLGQLKNHKYVIRFIATWKLVFAVDGDLATILEAVTKNDIDMLELAKDFISNSFIVNDCSVEYSNVDKKKVNKFIDDNWDKANTDDNHYKSIALMSDLRNNITNAIEKVIRVICRWIDRVEASGETKNDVGAERYTGIKKDLLINLQDSKHIIEDRFNGYTLDEKAGAKVLLSTINEIICRMDGSYSDKNHMYFYVDFLKGDDVLLDDNFMPDMRGSFVDFEELSVSNRILKHSKSQLRSFDEKLNHIFVDYGDDYGTAELIVKYLEDVDGYICPEKYNTMESEKHASQDAKYKLNEFIENLELAQSYGQIEETKENKKEKIQKIVNEWYKYAVETHNYGFFNMVLRQYDEKIQEDAKVRGKALSAELDNIKQMGNISQEKINIIEDLIKEQNYTLAEDSIARINTDESNDSIEVLNTDYLKLFLDNYDEYHNKVADCSQNLNIMVSRRIRNKDDRGGKKLAENWINSGQSLNVTRLSILLDTLGFNGAQVKILPKTDNKLDNCSITFKDNTNREGNYKHPISAFGSTAVDNGFRLVCLYGKYDADRLIEDLKTIPGNKATLVLLDYALSLPQRRTLARKSKKLLNDRVFGIIDRTLIMFLIENYNKQFVSSMLMSTMMPFTYCQPYVWNSNVTMPPEIFIGREKELAQIESPSGANIVYGGRQLGKSALLNKAMIRINNDDNNNRALCIDIKGKNYKEAAKKIGHELAMAEILPEDVDVDDWDELARIIKKRLLDKNKPEISYLLLLIDEADAFIESCEAVEYQPINALKDIQSIGIGRFKFVIAGLHNLVRFKRDASLKNNSLIAKLEHITIKPFDKREARQLLVKPLYYLGLRFPEDKNSQVLVATILANTNYFPGLIQLYCAKLIDAMSKDDYADYNENNAPVYEVNPNHIKKILADSAFMEQVREKFEITLKLDEDNMYYIIALLMAYLYHLNSNAASKINGYTVSDIIKIANEYSIVKIKDQKEDIISGLMKELQELNILRQTVDGGYLFSHYSFFQLMGTMAEVEEKMYEYMED